MRTRMLAAWYALHGWTVIYRATVQGIEVEPEERCLVAETDICAPEFTWREWFRAAWQHVTGG